MSLLEQKRPMTIDAFLAFTETRPDGERWELIDGEPVMSPSASRPHQKIIINLILALEQARKGNSEWEVLPGLGVKLSQTNMPIPDVLIRPLDSLQGYYCDDMIVAFEILSPSSRSMDLRWKRNAYPKLASLQHYVVLAQDKVALRCFDRARDWAEGRLGPDDSMLALPALDISLPVAALYAETGI